MRTPDEIFDESCAEWGYGPRLAKPAPPLFETRREQAHGWIKNIQAMESVKGLGTLHFDFVDNLIINAAVDIRDKMGIVGVLAGGVLLPWDLFVRLLSHPDVVRHIGNPDAEHIGPQHAEGVTQNYGALLQARQSRGPLSPLSPVDGVRRNFASIAAKVAFDFLVTHEIGHIVNGHVGYLFASCGLPYILELQAASSNPPHDPMTRQTLEMDADSAGVACSFGIVNIAKKHGGGEGYESFLSTEEQAMYVWAFAIAGFFYICGLKIDLATVASEIHPPTGLRFTMCQATALEIIRKHHPHLVDTFPQICRRALEDLLWGVKDIGGLMSDSDLKAYASASVDPKASEHVQKLLDRWKVIRPELVKFSFHQRLAP